MLAADRRITLHMAPRPGSIIAWPVARPGRRFPVPPALPRRQSAALGLVVRACLAIGVWGLFRGTGKSGLWRDGYELTVVAADAQDVEPGTPVRVRGVEAGRVVGVE